VVEEHEATIVQLTAESNVVALNHEATIATLEAESVATQAELEERKVAMEELAPVVEELRAAVDAHAQDLGSAEAALAAVNAADIHDDLCADVARLETEVAAVKRKLAAVPSG
jgi:capsule polysaccharide export protein KpsE/RkpR